MQMFLICVLFKGRSYYHGQGSLWLQTPVIFFEMRGCQWNSEWPGFPEKITRQSNCKEFQIYCVMHFYLWVWPHHPDQLSQNLEELAHIWFIPNVALFPRWASVAHPPFFTRAGQGIVYGFKCLQKHIATSSRLLSGTTELKPCLKWLFIRVRKVTE